jgi:ABC-type lipoprotein release transport system permease subunit
VALPISYNLRNLRVRWQVTLLAVSGIALVVAVFVILLSMVSGFRKVLTATGRADNVVVSQRGSNSELTSWINNERRNRVLVDERIARGADGEPLASSEIVVVANLLKKADGKPTNVTLRGVSQKAFEVRQGLRVVAGRNFTPGLDEVIVGVRIADRVAGLAVGDSFKAQKKNWTVVGHFEADGGAFESEVWGDLDVMGPSFQRTGGANSVVFRIRDTALLPAFAEEIRSSRELQHELIDERTYYENQSAAVATPLLALAGFVAIVMGVGAVFGALNTMYAIVSSRTREIGTLRALGFSRRSILVTFLIESVFLALVGGAIGCVLALPASGIQTGTGNTAGFAEVAWAFAITPRDLVVGLVFATAMGVIGGFLPSLRAARLPITSALRDA